MIFMFCRRESFCGSLRVFALLRSPFSSQNFDNMIFTIVVWDLCYVATFLHCVLINFDGSQEGGKSLTGEARVKKNYDFRDKTPCMIPGLKYFFSFAIL